MMTAMMALGGMHPLCLLRRLALHLFLAGSAGWLSFHRRMRRRAGLGCCSRMRSLRDGSARHGKGRGSHNRSNETVHLTLQITGKHAADCGRRPRIRCSPFQLAGKLIRPNVVQPIGQGGWGEVRINRIPPARIFAFKRSNCLGRRMVGKQNCRQITMPCSRRLSYSISILRTAARVCREMGKLCKRR